MAKYQSTPFYQVKHNDKTISFDYSGLYETDKQEEIEILDKLCPTWIKRVDEPKPTKPAEEPSESKPKATAKKSSAK